MRKPVMLKISILLFMVLSYTTVSAQDYVVTIKGDTLWGKVKYFGFSNTGGIKYAASSSKYVQLTPLEGKKSTHEVMQTISFRINDEVYHTIKFDQGYTFMKLLSSGYLGLYAYQMENQTTWDGRYFAKKDGSLLDVPNIGFKKRLAKYLADCPVVVQKIESGELTKSNLAKIVEEYNACFILKTNPKSEKKSPATEAWGNLETAVKALPEFSTKTDALDMIREIGNKVSKNENLPSFLINGLKESLKDQAGIKETLDLALAQVN